MLNKHLKEVGSHIKNMSRCIDLTCAPSTSPFEDSGRRTPQTICATLLFGGCTYSDVISDDTCAFNDMM